MVDMKRLVIQLSLVACLLETSHATTCAGDRFQDTCIKCNQGGCKTISAATADSADACCASCTKHSGCEFWTFNRKLQTCYLRHGSTSHKERGNCDAGIISSPLPACVGARFEAECIKCTGKCKEISHANATSADACCSMCQTTSGCEFYTFAQQESVCYMRAGEYLDRESGKCASGILQPVTPAPAPKPPAPATAKNILFIVVDDLRTDIGAYGADFMHTPNIDKLASTGVLFQRAYVQYSFCAPSRNSFLTGRRPDSTKAWSFMDHFRERGIGEQWMSMPQFFRERGYLTLGAGKLFHPGVPPSFDAPKSWDMFTSPGQCSGDTNGWPVLEQNVTNVACPAGEGGCPKDAMLDGDGTHWCKLDRSKLKAPLQDDVTVNVTIANLQHAKAEGRPFFIAAGFHKPHLPFQFPAEFDIYPPASEIKPPKHVLPPKDMPLCAWHEGNFDNKWDKPCNHTGEYRRAYYSSVSYTDANIGMVLAELDRLGLTDTTAVALLGDHGWQLGEMNLWRKMTNFELGVRVPLIFRAPWAQKAGSKTPALAEAVDIFPTFAELAGLSVPGSENLEGVSLARTIMSPPTVGTGAKTYAFSQFAKSSSFSKELQKSELWNTCTKCNRHDIEVMGYSVRNDNWRLTEWVGWDKDAWVPLWNQQVGLELYDHKNDFGEDLDISTPTVNMANNSQYSDVVADLRQVLRKHFANDYLPETWVV